MAERFGTRQNVVLKEELESVQKRASRFVTGNYNYETGSMTGILGQLKWDAQADLSLRWAHTHFVGFVMSWLKYRRKTKLLPESNQ